MYRHIVFFWMKDKSVQNLVIARDMLRSLAGRIEGLLSVEVEMDALHSERSCDLCLNMVFASREALDAYRTHPAHLPVQRHMHAVRSGSHAADYPITRPVCRMPRLYASLGPSCASPQILAKMLNAGMAGVQLSILHKPFEENAPWIDALYSAGASTGIAPEVLIAPGDAQRLPHNIRSLGATGVIISAPTDETAFLAIRDQIGPSMRLMVTVGSPADLEKLPMLLQRADEIVVGRKALALSAQPHEIPAIQKQVASAAIGHGTPFMVAADLLSSMREKPIPTAAEMHDIFCTVRDGAASLMLAQETAIGKYPVETMEALFKAAFAGTQAF